MSAFFPPAGVCQPNLAITDVAKRARVPIPSSSDRLNSGERSSGERILAHPPAAAGTTPSFIAEFLAACADVERNADAKLRVLDVGTGSARIPIALCAQKSQFAVVAVDRTAGVLRRAAERIHRADQNARIHLVLADGRSLPFPSQSFDAVVSNGLIHHVSDAVGLLREMQRVLRPGGLLFLRDSLRQPDADKIEQVLARNAAGRNRPGTSKSAVSFPSTPLELPQVQILLQAASVPLEWLRPSGPRHWSVRGIAPGG